MKPRQQHTEFEESAEKLDGLQPEADCLKLSPGGGADYFGGTFCIQLIPNALKSALLTAQFGEPAQVDVNDDDSVRTMDDNNVDIQKRILSKYLNFDNYDHENV